MSGIAAKFVTTPTISPLYKPLLDAWGGSGEMTVVRSPDRIVVTWVTRESHYHVSIIDGMVGTESAMEQPK